MDSTNADRQARFRERRAQRIQDLERKIAELEAENTALRNARGLRLEWQAMDETSYRAELPPYVLFVNTDEDRPWWWIGEDRSDGVDALVEVEAREASTFAIAKADAETAARSLISRATIKTDLVASLQKLLTSLHTEGKKHPAAASPGTVALVAHKLEVLLHAHGIIPKSRYLASWEKRTAKPPGA